MGQDPGAAGTPVTTAKDPEQIREEIEATRQDLGDTVAALAAKADVKTRVRDRIEHGKKSASHKRDELLGKAREASPEDAVVIAEQASRKVQRNPVPVVAVGAFAVGFALGRIIKRG
jgi:ElaB/YqjD/DUF883 family membrane-anchored ribosome-binding protein